MNFGFFQFVRVYMNGLGKSILYRWNVLLRKSSTYDHFMSYYLYVRIKSKTGKWKLLDRGNWISFGRSKLFSLIILHYIELAWRQYIQYTHVNIFNRGYTGYQHSDSIAIISWLWKRIQWEPFTALKANSKQRYCRGF